MCIEGKRWKALVVVLALFISGILSDAGAQQVTRELEPKLFSRLVVSPTNLPFPRMNLSEGVVPATRQFKVTNSGNETLTVVVGGVEDGPFVGDPPFMITEGAGTTALEPKGFAMVTVQFAPTANDKYSAKISITSDATKGKSSAKVKLSGSAIGASIAPSNTSSGSHDNGREGDKFINCSAGSGLSEHNLVLLAINTLGVGIVVNPPTTNKAGGHPAWNLIDTRTVSDDYTQQYYWHEVGKSETGGPTFVFNFSASVRAACVASAYTNTCLDSQNGCPNRTPISEVAFGTSTQSSTVSQITSLSFPNDSLVVGAFGTTDTNSRFGDAAVNPPGVDGASAINQGLGPNGSPFMSSVNSVTGNNGGLMIANLAEPFRGSDGPWLATLPQSGNWPTITITSLSGDGTMVTGTVAGSPPLQQYQQTSFTADIVGVSGGSSLGCFNGTFTVVPTAAAVFTYPNAGCSGTGNTTVASIRVHDPGVGDNIAQVISIKPNISLSLLP